MADTANLIKIQDVVDRYMYKYRIPIDDWDLYFEHVIDWFRDANIHHLRAFKTTTDTMSSLGVVDMPTDLIDLIAVSLPYKGRLWTLTRDRGVDITSMADDDQTQIPDAQTTGYGAVGGTNLYYYICDWDSRKIYINGLPAATVTLQYVSSGHDLTADTYVPSHAISAIDTYLRWKQAEIEGMGINERQLRRSIYNDEIMMMRRVNLPSYDEFKDIFRAINTQAPIR